MRLMQSAGAFNPVNLHWVLISHANIPLMQSVMRNRKLLVQTGLLPLHGSPSPSPSPSLSSPSSRSFIAMNACETRARLSTPISTWRVSSVFSICQENNNNCLCVYTRVSMEFSMDFLVNWKIFRILENILRQFSYSALQIKLDI